MTDLSFPLAHVTAVRGPVLDIRVQGPLPAIHDVVEIGPVLAEVAAHVDATTLRAIARS